MLNLMQRTKINKVRALIHNKMIIFAMLTNGHGRAIETDS